MLECNSHWSVACESMKIRLHRFCVRQTSLLFHFCVVIQESSHELWAHWDETASAAKGQLDITLIWHIDSCVSACVRLRNPVLVAHLSSRNRLPFKLRRIGFFRGFQRRLEQKSSGSLWTFENDTPIHTNEHNLYYLLFMRTLVHFSFLSFIFSSYALSRLTVSVQEHY